MRADDSAEKGRRFLATVRERAADLETDQEARDATAAVLEVLAEHLAGPAAEELARSLPPFAAQPLHGGNGQPEPAGTDEFLASVAEREGPTASPPAAVAGHVQAVFRAVAETADPTAVESAREQLTAELRRLWVPEAEEPPPGERPAVRTEPIERKD